MVPCITTSPSFCKWKLLELISILPWEPLTNCDVLPKKNSSVCTLNVLGLVLNFINLSVAAWASTISNPTPSYASEADSLLPPTAPSPIEPLNNKNPPLPLAIVLSNPSYPTDLINAGLVPYISTDSPINNEPVSLASNPSAIICLGPANVIPFTWAVVSAKLLFES